MVRGKVIKSLEKLYLICLGDQGEILLYDLDFDGQQEVQQPVQTIMEPSKDSLSEDESNPDRLMHHNFLHFLCQDKSLSFEYLTLTERSKSQSESESS